MFYLSSWFKYNIHIMKKVLIFILTLTALAGCHQAYDGGKSDIEKNLEEKGLQNVAEEIPGIEIHMVYSTPYNFMEWYISLHLTNSM